jgi:hypothetical protein
MHAERRAAAAIQADMQATAHTDAHRRNLEAARTAMVVAEQSLAEADQSGGLASVAEHAIDAKTSTLASFDPWQER